MGNPATDWEGCTDYVVASVPQLESLDGKAISKSQRIRATQRLAALEAELSQLAAAKRREKAAAAPARTYATEADRRAREAEEDRAKAAGRGPGQTTAAPRRRGEETGGEIPADAIDLDGLDDDDDVIDLPRPGIEDVDADGLTPDEQTANAAFGSGGDEEALPFARAPGADAARGGRGEAREGGAREGDAAQGEGLRA